MRGLYRLLRAVPVSLQRGSIALHPLLPGARVLKLCGKIQAVVLYVPPARDDFTSVARNFMIEPEESPTPEPKPVTHISQDGVRSVQAEVVRMHQAAAESIHADEVALQQSAASDVRANSVSAYQAALATVEAEEVLTQRSAIGYVQAEKASVNGYTGAVVAKNAEVHYGMTGVVVGNDVHAEGARAILLVGRNVTGNVTPLMDARSALIAGLTGGLFAGLLLLLGRALFGRK